MKAKILVPLLLGLVFSSCRVWVDPYVKPAYVSTTTYVAPAPVVVRTRPVIVHPRPVIVRHTPVVVHHPVVHHVSRVHHVPCVHHVSHCGGRGVHHSKKHLH